MNNLKYEYLRQNFEKIQSLLDKEENSVRLICDTDADTQQKQCSAGNWMLIDNMLIAVTFVHGITSNVSVLSINNSGYVPLYRREEPLTGGTVSPNATLLMMYSAASNRWNILSGVDAEVFWQ